MNRELYTVTQESPKELRKLISRFPQTLQIYRNIVQCNHITDRVYFESGVPDEDDALLEFILSKMVASEIVKLDFCDSSAKYLPLYSDIIINSNSFSKNEFRVYSQNMLKMTLSAVQNNHSRGMRASGFFGSMSQENYDLLLQEIASTFEKYRDVENGEIKFVLNFTTQEV